MDIASESVHGIQLLVEKYRNEFRCPENSNFYAENDYKKAERKYVKFCLSGKSKGRIRTAR